MKETLEKLLAIKDEGKLGELRERFAYAKRDTSDYDQLEYTHAVLDAEDLGAVAYELFGIDPGEARDMVLEIIAPDVRQKLAAELVDELIAEINGTPKPQASKRRAW